jgi:hypothetical protein
MEPVSMPAGCFLVSEALQLVSDVIYSDCDGPCRTQTVTKNTLPELSKFLIFYSAANKHKQFLTAKLLMPFISSNKNFYCRPTTLTTNTG